VTCGNTCPRLEYLDRMSPLSRYHTTLHTKKYSGPMRHSICTFRLTEEQKRESSTYYQCMREHPNPDVSYAKYETVTVYPATSERPAEVETRIAKVPASRRNIKIAVCETNSERAKHQETRHIMAADRGYYRLLCCG
jgi:hypothetical protein